MSSVVARDAVVDDTDTRIRYTGQSWFQDHGSQDAIGNYGATYNHTQHGTTGNDSFSFSFRGTSIFVVGTFARVSIQNGTRIDPSWECFVDGVSIGDAGKHMEDPSNNYDLCGRSDLIDGHHNLTVNVTTTGTPFWVDYLTFTPSPNASVESTVSYVDSEDPGIEYNPK